MKTRQILRLLLFLPLICYIYISIYYDNDITTREGQKNKFISDNFRVDKIGDLNFTISSKDWPFKDKLDNEFLLLSLKFDNNVDIHQSKLIFQINAFAKSKERILNRLILHDFINDSSEIILKNHDLFGDKVNLGLLSNFSYEDIIIKICILQPDSILNNAKPRLEIENYKGSSGVYGYAIFNVWINNFILILSIICVTIYVFIGYKKENYKI
jgi:hypothetical protein